MEVSVLAPQSNEIGKVGHTRLKSLTRSLWNTDGTCENRNPKVDVVRDSMADNERVGKVLGFCHQDSSTTPPLLAPTPAAPATLLHALEATTDDLKLRDPRPFTSRRYSLPCGALQTDASSGLALDKGDTVCSPRIFYYFGCAVSLLPSPSHPRKPQYYFVSHRVFLIR
jgi:hypothetical protein